MGGGGGDYTGVYPVNVDNTAREISVDSLPLVTDSSMTAYGSAGSSVIGVNLDIMNGKLDSSAQVVTATATQLYAGTAYLTSVNGAPVSASRAGNAANASLANSAWYDGTGRFISALPDSATVSSIASAYAESAASGKLDTTAFNSADFYTTANESGFITGLPRNITAIYVSASGHVRAGSTTTDLYGNFDYAGMYFRRGVNRPYNIGLDNTGSNFYIATAKNGYARIYASSIQTWNSYSAKQDALTFGYDTEDRISGINGSAIAGGIDSTTCSAIASSYAESAASSKQDTLSFAYNTADQISSINGSALGGMDEAAVSGIASAYAQSAASSKLDASASSSFYSTSNPSGFITGVDLTPYQPTSAMSAYATTAFVESGLSGKENVFSAGTGLEFVQSGSDRVLQVEAPVDIVAGPGIVIDNPDGNTLRVSVAQAEEVVLYDGELKQVTNNAPVSGNVLSETFRNFKRVLLIGHTDDGIEYPFSILLEPLNSSGDMAWSVAVNNPGWCKWFYGKLNGTTITLTLGRVLTMGTTSWDYLHDWTINKVIGIHRIAGGN
jgi:hypothetical protein